MKAIVITTVVVMVFCAGLQVLTTFKTNSDLSDLAKRYLELVDGKSAVSVKQDLARDAQKLGVTLAPEHIQITYEDTDIQSMAQRIVGRKLGAQYQNKRVGIVIHYTAHIALLPFAQEVAEMKIIQVAAPVIPPTKQAQELLDSQ